MKDTLDRIWKRFKKLFILLILIPFLTAGAAYLFQKNGPSTYTANAEIQLINFTTRDVSLPIFTNFTDVEYAKKYMISKTFLNKIEKRNPNFSAETVKSKVNFVIEPAKVIKISYTGNDPKEAKDNLNLIIKEYVNESKEARNDLIVEIEKLKQLPEANMTPGDYNIYILGLKQAEVSSEEVQLEQPQENAKNTTVFGFLIGLILSSMILLLPEVFRK